MLCLTACHKNQPYDESADAKAEIASAQQAATLAHVPLVIIFGANWCKDCQALSAALKDGKNAAKMAQAFKIVKVNVGNFDTNLDVAQAYGNPIQGGIPGAAILSEDGKVLYVTKPGELATVRRNGDDGIYTFFQKASTTSH